MYVLSFMMQTARVGDLRTFVVTLSLVLQLMKKQLHTAMNICGMLMVSD